MAKYIISAIILAFGLYLIVPDRDLCKSGSEVVELAERCEISYEGIDGKTALEILKENHQVETNSFGEFGEFVKSINGIDPSPTHFWAFYLNGQPSQVGAGAYQTQTGDSITWKLEKIQ